MKFATSVSILALAGGASASCSEDLLNALIPLYQAQNDQSTMIAYCANAAAVKAKFDTLIATCTAEVGGEAMEAPLSLLSDIVCSSDPKDTHMCYVDFAKLIPWNELIAAGAAGAAGANPDFNFVDSFVKDKLSGACGNDYCTRNYKEIAIKLGSQLGGAGQEVAYKYARDLVTACTNSFDPVSGEGEWCAERFKNVFETGAFTVPALDDVCANGQVRPCIKKALSQRLIFGDNGLVCPTSQQFICDKAAVFGTFTLEKLESLCNCDTCDQPKRTPNVYTFEVSNIKNTTSLDQIQNALLTDLLFNLEDIDITKFTFAGSARRLLTSNTISVTYETEDNRFGEGCSDFLFPTFGKIEGEDITTGLEVTCTGTVAYPAGYTPPPTPVKQELSSASSISTAAAFVIVATAAIVF